MLAMAGIRVEVGQPGQARTLLQKAMTMQSRLRGEVAHPLMAYMLTLEASLDRDAGRFEMAQIAIGKAASIAARLKGSELEKAAAAIDGAAGQLALTQGKPVDAIAPLERQLAYLRSFYQDVPHPNLARGLARLAIALARSGRSDEATKLTTESRAVLVKVFPDGEHSSYAGLLLADASVLQARNQHADAVKLLLQALAIREKRIGKEPSPEKQQLLRFLADSASKAGLPSATAYQNQANAMQAAWLSRQ